MNDKIINFVIIVLILSILGLGGFLVYNYLDIGNSSTTSTGQEMNQDTTNVQQLQQGQTQQQAETSGDRPLSDDERRALEFPGENASEQEIAEHSQLVANLSRSSSILDITNCQPDPVVLKATPDTNFTVINQGSSDHTIYYNIHQHRIPANGRLDLNVNNDFREGLGLFGYACDGQGVVGIIAVYSE